MESMMINGRPLLCRTLESASSLLRIYLSTKFRTCLPGCAKEIVELEVLLRIAPPPTLATDLTGTEEGGLAAEGNAVVSVRLQMNTGTDDFNIVLGFE